MPVPDNTHAYRGRLPHFLKADRTYYVTFCTRNREVPPSARDVVLASCLHDHEQLCWLDTAVVMPDHVHLIVMPSEDASLPQILRRIKSASAYRINRILPRAGSLWQRESFDRIVRGGENLDVKREYILDNPVRAGLVDRVEDYPWTWWSERGAAGS